MTYTTVFLLLKHIPVPQAVIASLFAGMAGGDLIHSSGINLCSITAVTLLIAAVLMAVFAFQFIGVRYARYGEPNPSQENKQNRNSLLVHNSKTKSGS